MSSKDVIERYWSAFIAQDIDEIAKCLHPEVVVRYPQSGEVFRGRENCLAILRDYPGGLPDATAESLETDPQTVVIPSPHPFGAPIVTVTGGNELFVGQAVFRYPDGLLVHTVSIYRIRDNLIASETAYFGEPFEPSEWRQQFRSSE